ncbi:MAG: hypothetical protein E3K37_13350 [Candidatus Kuenenia sp.]|nr:hypothetical protein [Candidatus Kuenenia hertensis]
MEDVPFYANFNFWSVLVAFAALIISLSKPIYRLIRRGKLGLNVYEKVLITHSFGNPNLQFHLIINNMGGRKVLIESFEAELTKEEGTNYLIKAQNYYKEQVPQVAILFTRFTLFPCEEWAHITNFFNDFTTAEEREYKSLVKEIKDDLERKSRTQPDKNTKVEADEEIIKRTKDFFHRKFIWSPGDYKLRIKVNCSNDKYNIHRDFRFTLFESDSEELRSYTDKYKYGLGVYYYDYREMPGVTVKLHMVNI